MKKFLLTFTIIMSTTLSANAFIDTQHMSTEQHMLNTGYSAEIARMAEITTRDVYAPTDDKYPHHNFKRFMKVLWKKVDSTAFPNENGTWHDINMSTGFYDLN